MVGLGDKGVKYSLLGENPPMLDALMDGAESCLWGMALNGDSECFVGCSIMDVVDG